MSLQVKISWIVEYLLGLDRWVRPARNRPTREQEKDSGRVKPGYTG